MQSNFPQSNDRTSSDGSENHLERMVDGLMPRLHSSWKQILLEDSQSKVTGAEVARMILQKRQRTDVKVCLIQDERNCYNPLLNWIGLSKDVADSQSIIAVAIAAHEIGHAFQPMIVEKVCTLLKKSPTSQLSIWGKLFILNIKTLIQIPRTGIVPEEGIISWSIERRIQSQDFTRYETYELGFPQQFKHSRASNSRHPSRFVTRWVQWGFILLLTPIIFLLFCFVRLLLICYILMCRCIIFAIEIHASWLALRLLKQYKILARHERKAARKFLRAAALTYLRSCSFDSLIA